MSHWRTCVIFLFTALLICAASAKHARTEPDFLTRDSRSAIALDNGDSGCHFEFPSSQTFDWSERIPFSVVCENVYNLFKFRIVLSPAFVIDHPGGVDCIFYDTEGCIHEFTAATDFSRTNFTATLGSNSSFVDLSGRFLACQVATSSGEVLITNDGATIMKQMQVHHPTAKMLVELSKSQDIEAGDGTTSVVVIAGSLLNQCLDLFKKGIHPTTIAESFQKGERLALEILEKMSRPVALDDLATLNKIAATSLSSKVIAQNSDFLAPLAVNAVLRVAEPDNVDLNNIRVVHMLGGTMDDCELVDGLVFPRKATKTAGGPKRIQNAKVGLAQFCLSPPKTDIDSNIVVRDYAAMDRIMREERQYIVKICKKIRESGCNVLLIQKSVLRDAVSDLALHYLAKMKIMVVKNIARDEVEFISKTLGLKPCASVESFNADKLGKVQLCEEVASGPSRAIYMTGVANPGKTVSVVLRASNNLILEEAGRSLHDAFCVIRCLVKKKFIIAGGAAAETQVAVELMKMAKEMKGRTAFCVRAFAEALEVIPSTLAENAGLSPIGIVTELRNRHVKGDKDAGISVRKGGIANMYDENVVQPLLVSTSALSLAAECVRMILKIDDIVATR